MIRVYGIKEHLMPVTEELSDIINSCMVDALVFPDNKRAHRLIPLDARDFYYPEGRSASYTVIEINMMEGRSVEARKRLIHLLFERVESKLGISPIDLEITLNECPATNWGFRGMTGDETDPDYEVNV